MDAKHALFLFDRCFSGSIFKQINLLPRHPPQISQWTMQPVRQFISARSAGETVPANSTFTPAIIDAINGKADLNNDGYVIGTEIGLFLQNEVPRHVNQPPSMEKLMIRYCIEATLFFSSTNLLSRLSLKMKKHKYKPNSILRNGY